jgi:hypothetical protein
MRLSKRSLIVAALAGACALSGCGLQVNSPDLFLLKRSGQGRTISLLVNDDGTIHCDGRSRALPDPLLLQARDLASKLDQDAKAKLRLPAGKNSVFQYSIRLQHGTITFPDTAARSHHELALAEQFALQAAQNPCRLSG